MNLGMPEIIGLTILGLILFGPKKLPEMGRQLGKLMAEFKRASQEFQNQLQDEVRQLEMEDEVKKVKEAVQPIGTTAREVHGSLQNILSDSTPSITPSTTEASVSPTSEASAVSAHSTHNG
jgi:sec-independent protein translocase protein TatB